MTVRYAISFEFDQRPSQTHRGIVSGGSGATCVARATREAQRALQPRGWSSMVCVLLERLDAEREPEPDQPDDIESPAENCADSSGDAL